MIPIREQVECVERELGFRRRIYPKWVALCAIKQEQAEYQIKCMKAVLETLQAMDPNSSRQIRLLNQVGVAK